MADKSIIIIGGGIAGLSMGAYAQMNGYRTRIFEAHDLPGGLCTAWQRSGFTINGCLHLLVGCSESSDFYTIWKELGAMQGRGFAFYEDFVSFEGSDGQIFTLHSNVDKLEAHMLELAPEDSLIIGAFIKAVRQCMHFKPPILKIPELYGLIDGIGALSRIIPHVGLLRKWGRISMAEFAKKFKCTVLREMFTHLWFPDSPVLFFMMMLSMLHQKSSGYPLGGSLDFSQAIEKRYSDLGGKCYYGVKVAKVIVENDQAVGIQLEDGSEHRADYVISAADGYSTIFKMLDGNYTNKKIHGYFENLPIFPPLIYINFGLKQHLDLGCGNSQGIDIPLEEPLTVADEEITRLGLRLHDFDASAAPEGKSLAKVLIPSNIAYWEALYTDPERYQAEKMKIYDQVIAIFDERYPGFANMIEMRDMATPITTVRYTGNWQGSHQGWMVTANIRYPRMKNTLPGLKNFYMVGHWVEAGGGVPSAALSGRNVTQFLCKRDKKNFVTTVA